MEHTFSIPLMEDRNIEPTEQFAAIATSTVGGVTISPDRAIVNIQDNDGSCEEAFVIYTLIDHTPRTLVEDSDTQIKDNNYLLQATKLTNPSNNTPQFPRHNLLL